MARLRLRGLGFAVASYTWASRGETLVPTLAAQTRPPRSKRKAAHAAPVLIGLRPLHLCGTRLEGGHQGLSRRYGQLEGESWELPPKPAGTANVQIRHFRRGERCPHHCAALRGRSQRAGVDRLAMPTSQQPKRRCFVGSTRTNLRGGHRRLCAATPAHRRLCAATSTRRRLCASPPSASPGFRDEPY